MNQNENNQPPLQLEAKAPSTPPSLDAVNMKREQNRLQDKHVIELLDKRRLLTEAQKQNDADLLFVGYRPPMEAPQPKMMTEEQWVKLHADEGEFLYLESIVNSNSELLEKTQKELAWVKGLHAQLKEKNKTISNELRALRKAKGYVSHKTVMNTLGKIKNKSSKKK